ncbi:MAG: alpha/beta fold hydrolase [Pseudomonadota bacterium]
MAEASSLVRKRPVAGLAGICALLLAALMVLPVPGCSPVTQRAFNVTEAPTPMLDIASDTFISFDGAPLGLTVWEAAGGAEPDIVVVGLHGMNDWANAFYMAAPFWAQHGVTTYAYDQRGFGRSPNRGIWPKEDLMREDLRTAVSLARARHPDAILAVVGISMGGAVAMSTFGTDGAPPVDRLVLSGPGLRGWGALPLSYRTSLWMSARVRPGWVVTPPRRFVRIEPTDNLDMLREIWSSPMMLRENRIDQVHGVVSLMETAHRRAPNLPADRTLMAYGANDYVIPPPGVQRTAAVLPVGVRTVYYPEGYHMLLRDMQAERVWTDYLAFFRDPEAPLPSGEAPWPWVQGSEAELSTGDS